jgi:hypothetical protein
MAKQIAAVDLVGEGGLSLFFMTLRVFQLIMEID